MLSRRVIYLHGFASSPESRKARFFAGKLELEGFQVEIPDLAASDFEHLTITGQLRIISALLEDRLTVLIGSSLGGYLAALAAARHPEVQKVVMLAPAFGFHDLWTKELGKERLEIWRKNSTISIFHYGENKMMPLGFGLMEDAARYEAFPDLKQPSLIFHGLNDPLVPIGLSRRYAMDHANIQLSELRSGHELTDVLEDMWAQAKPFLLAEVREEPVPLGI